MKSPSQQRTLAMMTGFERYTKKTRRAIFLEEMEQVAPWAKLCALIEPHYPKPGNGRRPKELEKMLRIYFLQQWFNLADPAVEEALYDSATLRQFAGIDLGGEPVPDETTVCNFRHLLENTSSAISLIRFMQVIVAIASIVAILIFCRSLELTLRALVGCNMVPIFAGIHH